MTTMKTFRKTLPDGGVIIAEVQFDDECRNGHRTLAITGEIYERGQREPWAFGCIHEEIAEHFPQLRPLIPYHLCSEDGPMHYLANTVYLAGDRDFNGKRKGEVLRSEHVITFGDNPIAHRFPKHPRFLDFLRDHAPAFDLKIIELPHDGKGKPNEYRFAPKYTFGGYGSRWHEGPFDTKADAVSFLTALQHCNPRFLEIPAAWSEGKPRELDSARRSAIWPDATDEELSQDPETLKVVLLARLPALLADFRAKIESIGLDW
jgi:hypothetical protein